MKSKEKNFSSQAPQLDLSEGSEMLTDFSREAQRHLISARNSILVLEAMASDKETLENIFKTFHTIKGLADFLNLSDIFHLTNEAEVLMDMARKNFLHVNDSIIKLIRETVLRLQQLLELLDEQIANNGALKSAYPDIGALIAAMRSVTSHKVSLDPVAQMPYPKAIPTIQFEPDLSLIAEIKRQIKVHVKEDFLIDKQHLGEIIGNFERTTNELKEAQGKLQERQRELINERELAIKLTQQAQSDARAKSEYLANMSHEIRTLINAILGFTDVLKESNLTERQQKHLSTIIVSGKMLLEIVNDILDFSKVEAGKLRLENIPFNLEHIIEEVFRIIRTRLVSKPINLYFTIPEGVPMNFLGDPTRFKQIFINLLDNAIKFTEQGEIGIEVLLPEDKNKQDGKKKIQVMVADTGIGIPEENQKNIFESFTQADSSTTRIYGGTGLGLALCKTFIEKMGGDIHLESALGQGSRFIFNVCLAPADNVEQIDIFKNFNSPNAEVMIVDAHEKSVQKLTDLCRRSKLEILPLCTNAKQASELLVQHESKNKSLPSIIFIDALLPDRQGFMLAYKIRQQNRYQNVKLVALSSDVKLDTSSDFRQAGFDLLLAKPLLTGEFAEIVSLVLQNKPRKTHYISHEMIDRISCEGLEVLVVEDSVPNQELLKFHLESLGCKCDYASNGQEAIELLKKKTYDICFMDLHMPILDGIKATKIIREELDISVPIIALTAAEIQEEKERCVKIGMNDYLAKPFDVVELKEKIVKLTRM